VSYGLALFLMVLSAALHAIWNVALRRHPDAPAAVLLFLLGAAALMLFAGVVDTLFFERDANALEVAFLWSLAAGVTEGIRFAALARAIRIGPLATVYTVSRGVPLLALWPASVLLFHERYDLQTVVAVLVLLAGLFVLSPRRNDAPSGTTTRAGYLWAILAAAATVVYNLAYKAALVRGAPVLPLFGAALIVAAPISAAGLSPWELSVDALAHRMGRAFLAGPWIILVGSVAFGGSFLAALYTMKPEGAAWVMTMRNLSIALAPLLAWALLHERPSMRAFVGVALVFAGALVLGLSLR